MNRKKCKSEGVEWLVDIINETFPNRFRRSAITDLSSGMINSRTVSNKMSLGRGPHGYRVGRYVWITRQSLIEWLKNEVEIRRV